MVDALGIDSFAKVKAEVAALRRNATAVQAARRRLEASIEERQAWLERLQSTIDETAAEADAAANSALVLESKLCLDKVAAKATLLELAGLRANVQRRLRLDTHRDSTLAAAPMDMCNLIKDAEDLSEAATVAAVAEMRERLKSLTKELNIRQTAVAAANGRAEDLSVELACLVEATESLRHDICQANQATHTHRQALDTLVASHNRRVREFNTARSAIAKDTALIDRKLADVRVRSNHRRHSVQLPRLQYSIDCSSWPGDKNCMMLSSSPACAALVTPFVLLEAGDRRCS